MNTSNISINAIYGPSPEMVIALVDVILASINTHCDLFDVDVDSTLLKIHEDIDFGIDTLKEDYPDVVNVDYIMTYDDNVCDFVPCNEYTEEVVDIIRDILGI